MKQHNKQGRSITLPTLKCDSFCSHVNCENQPHRLEKWHPRAQKWLHLTGLLQSAQNTHCWGLAVEECAGETGYVHVEGWNHNPFWSCENIKMDNKFNIKPKTGATGRSDEDFVGKAEEAQPTKAKQTTETPSSKSMHPKGNNTSDRHLPRRQGICRLHCGWRTDWWCGDYTW